MSEWQDISTAPKDGTKLVLCYKDGDTCHVFATCEWSTAGCISEEGFWLWWQSEPEYLVEVKKVSHWMPLPAPPA